MIPLTAQHKLWLGGMAAVVAAVCATRFLYLPLSSRLQAQRARLQELRVNIAEAHALVERLPEQEAALRQAVERSRLLAKRIERGQSMARVLETLTMKAKDRRVELVAVQQRADEHPQEPVSLGSELVLRPTPLALQLIGRYRSVAEFLGRLSDAPFIASIQTLTMAKPQPDSLKLRADLELTVYLLE